MVAAVLIVSLFVMTVMVILIQRNLRDRVVTLEEEPDQNLTPLPITPINPIEPTPIPVNTPSMRTDCFSFVPDVEIYVGVTNDFNSNILWRQAKESEGAVVEPVDLSLLPNKSDVNPVFISTSNYEARVTHVPDFISLPDSNPLNILRVESPISTGSITLPVKGLETSNGNNANGDAFEFIFTEPVGIVSFDCIDLRGSPANPTVIRLWDENNVLFWQEGLPNDYDESLIFVGINDPLNRIKTMRMAIGTTTTSNSNTWSIANLSMGRNSPYGVCDVNRVIRVEEDQIEVFYQSNSDQSLITDPEVIQELLPDP